MKFQKFDGFKKFSQTLPFTCQSIPPPTTKEKDYSTILMMQFSINNNFMYAVFIINVIAELH